MAAAVRCSEAPLSISKTPNAVIAGLGPARSGNRQCPCLEVAPHRSFPPRRGGLADALAASAHCVPRGPVGDCSRLAASAAQCTKTSGSGAWHSRCLSAPNRPRKAPVSFRHSTQQRRRRVNALLGNTSSCPLCEDAPSTCVFSLENALLEIPALSASPPRCASGCEGSTFASNARLSSPHAATDPGATSRTTLSTCENASQPLHTDQTARLPRFPAIRTLLLCCAHRGRYPEPRDPAACALDLVAASFEKALVRQAIALLHIASLPPRRKRQVLPQGLGPSYLSSFASRQQPLVADKDARVRLHMCSKPAACRLKVELQRAAQAKRPLQLARQSPLPNLAFVCCCSCLQLPWPRGDPFLATLMLRLLATWGATLASPASAPLAFACGCSSLTAPSLRHFHLERRLGLPRL